MHFILPKKHFTCIKMQQQKRSIKQWKRRGKRFVNIRNMSLKTRADFMRAIGSELENNADELIKTAMRETQSTRNKIKKRTGPNYFSIESIWRSK